MASSYKPQVIEQIFRDRWNETTSTLSNSVVTLADVQAGIRAYNRAHGTAHSDKNPANFFKDFIRNKASANQHWPSYLIQQGYTARQLTSGGNVFEFVPLLPDQGDPFPLNVVPPPSDHTPRHRIESLSLPLASRRLGRRDETWLTQVLARLRVVETHLSIYSARSFLQVDHLQMNVKLSGAEVDALYLGIEDAPGAIRREVLICLEAKGRRDDVLEDQILKQVSTLFNARGITQDEIVPMAAKVIRNAHVHVIEFEAIARTTISSAASLKVVSDAVYELTPAVPGIH